MTQTLDGSLVPRFQTEFAARIAQLLRFAAERKQSGIGIFSRPEADSGLASLAALMTQLDPAASSGTGQRACCGLAPVFVVAAGEAQPATLFVNERVVSAGGLVTFARDRQLVRGPLQDRPDGTCSKNPGLFGSPSGCTAL